MFIHTDMLGSPMATTDERGNIISRENVTPYGDSLGKRDASNSVAVGSPEHGSGYTGHVRDRDLGLTYMQARYYDPTIGRFMGADPVGFLDNGDPAYFNRYVYAKNSPYSYIDQDGRDAVSIEYEGYSVNTGFGFNAPLGHAGVLLIDEATGFTKYYEYGRYSPTNHLVIGEKLDSSTGNIRNVEVPNVEIDEGGQVKFDSLQRIYSGLSSLSGPGKGYQVKPNYHKGADFELMEEYVRGFAGDEDRESYSILGGNHCFGFADDVVEAGYPDNTNLEEEVAP